MPPYIRGVTRRLLLRAFRNDGGWTQVEGSNHTVMRKGDRRTAIPRLNGDLPPPIVGSIIVQAGWTVSRFRALAGRRGANRRRRNWK